MRYSLTIITFVIALSSTFSQRTEGMQKIEAARIAMITHRLELTPEQAEKFWPLYNEFTSKRRALRTNYEQNRLKTPPDNLTEKEQKELIKKGIELKQEELDLEKEYSEKLLTVISTGQLLTLKQAEDDFRAMLFNRLDQNRHPGKRPKPHLENRKR